MDPVTQILLNLTEHAHYAGLNREGVRLYYAILSCRKGKSREREVSRWQADFEQKLKAAHVPFDRVYVAEKRCKSIHSANDEGKWAYVDYAERGYLSVIEADIVMQKDYIMI